MKPLAFILPSRFDNMPVQNFHPCGVCERIWQEPFLSKQPTKDGEKRHDNLAPVVRRLDNAIHRINRYPLISVDKTDHAINWIVIYPLDSVIQLSNNPGVVRTLTLTQCDPVPLWKILAMPLYGIAITSAMLFCKHEKKISKNKNSCSPKVFLQRTLMDILSVFCWKFFELSDFRQFLYISGKHLWIPRVRVNSESTRPLNPHSASWLGISSSFFNLGFLKSGEV